MNDEDLFEQEDWLKQDLSSLENELILEEDTDVEAEEDLSRFFEDLDKMDSLHFEPSEETTSSQALDTETSEQPSPTIAFRDLPWDERAKRIMMHTVKYEDYFHQCNLTSRLKQKFSKPKFFIVSFEFQNTQQQFRFSFNRYTNVSPIYLYSSLRRFCNEHESITLLHFQPLKMSQDQYSVYCQRLQKMISSRQFSYIKNNLEK